MAPGGVAADQVRVKQEPGTKEDYGCAASNSNSSSSSVKTERGNDSGRSACMVTPPSLSPSHLPFLLSPSPARRRHFVSRGPVPESYIHNVYRGCAGIMYPHHGTFWYSDHIEKLTEDAVVVFK